LNKPINTQKIEQLFEGAPDELATFIVVILAQFAEYEKEIAVAVSNRNYLAVKDLRHKIKSICLSFDVPNILEEMLELMTLLEAEKPDDNALQSKLSQLHQSMHWVVSEIKIFQSQI